MGSSLYNSNELFRLAKRWNNSKRAYLLVNLLQGKHVPVSPGRALDMMQQLGKKIAKHFSDIHLVIGFAETATAIGAVVANCFGSDCKYLHTTRENLSGVQNWIFFQEEHSHASDQKLCGDLLENYFSNDDSSQILFIDDEFSTGKTLLNIVLKLRERFSKFSDFEVIAGSIFNRLKEPDLQKLSDFNITTESLLNLPDVDYQKIVSNIEVESTLASDTLNIEEASIEFYDLKFAILDPRYGVLISDYRINCERMAQKILDNIKKSFENLKKIVVLGTEECMFPGLILAHEMEKSGLFESVRFHATTRSPIGIHASENYPVKNGFQLRSVYDEMRVTYLYNLEYYDAAILLSDAPNPEKTALQDLAKALKFYGCPRLIYLKFT